MGKLVNVFYVGDCGDGHEYQITTDNFNKWLKEHNKKRIEEGEISESRDDFETEDVNIVLFDAPEVKVSLALNRPEINIYRVFDEEDGVLNFYATEQEIIDWLLETQADAFDFDEEDIKEKGWEYWMEKSNTSYEVIKTV